MDSDPQKVASGSHCFEPDGSFHVVCMFVIGVSIFCGSISLFCTYKVIKMCISLIRDPDNVGENVKMYKLQPASQLKEDVEFSSILKSSSHQDCSTNRNGTTTTTSKTNGCSPHNCAHLNGGKRTSMAAYACGGCACGSSTGSSNVNNIETVETVFIKQEDEQDFPDSPCIC